MNLKLTKITKFLLDFMYFAGMPDTAIYIQMVRILQRSVCYLLLAACRDLFPVRRSGNFADWRITENV